MIKTKLFKVFCIMIVASTICIVPTNIMKASKAQTIQGIDADKKIKKEISAENNIYAKSNISVKKKENSVIVNTNLSEQDHKKLFKEYKKYGIEKKDGILYYKNKKIRCFADIYCVESHNKEGGITINSKSIYSYFNENGKVDFCIERENIMDTETWSFEKIINTSKSIRNVVFAMPDEAINKLIEECIKNRDYKDLECFIIYAKEESIDNAAKQILANGDYEILETFVWSVSKDALGEIGEQLIEKGQYAVLQNIICFMDNKGLEKIVKLLCEKGEYTIFSNIVWALDKSTVDAYAKQFAEKGKGDVLCNIAYAVSSDAIGEIAGILVKNKRYDLLQNIICFVPKEDVDKIARQLCEDGSYKVLGGIAWAVSSETLEELAKTVADKGEYDALLSIAPYIAYDNN